MAQIDTSIYNMLGRGVKSVQDYDAEAQAAESAKLGNVLNRAKVDEYQRGIEQQNQLLQLLSGGADANALRKGGFLTQANEWEKNAAQVDKDKAAADASKASANKSSSEVIDQTMKRYRAGLDFIETPQGAARWLEAQYQDPIIGSHIAALSPFDQAVKNIPTDPQAFEQWRQKAGLGMEAYIKKMQEDTKIAETARNNKTQTDVQIRGQNLTNARGVEANNLKAAEIAQGGKPPPGYKWNTDGSLQAIPGGPGDKLPEAQQKQVIGVQNLSNAIKEYRDALKTFKAGDALNPNARATMGTKYNNMLLQAKEAYNLGVLNGPDYEILQSVVTDPRSVKGVITSNDALDTQASELDRIMGGIASTSSQTRPRGAAPGQQPAKSKTIVQTGTHNGKKVVKYSDGSIEYADQP